MMMAVQIVLATRMDAAREKLGDLAGASWMLSLPQHRAAYAAHPAGRGRPGPRVESGAGLVAVAFGQIGDPARDRIALPVTWEPVEPGGAFTVQLDGDLTLAPAAERGHSVLTLTGSCWIPLGALAGDGREQVRLEFMEASREFITGVARYITGSAT